MTNETFVTTAEELTTRTSVVSCGTADVPAEQGKGAEPRDGAWGPRTAGEEQVGTNYPLHQLVKQGRRKVESGRRNSRLSGSQRWSRRNGGRRGWVGSLSLLIAVRLLRGGEAIRNSKVWLEGRFDRVNRRGGIWKHSHHKKAEPHSQRKGAAQIWNNQNKNAVENTVACSYLSTRVTKTCSAGQSKFKVLTIKLQHLPAHLVMLALASSRLNSNSCLFSSMNISDGLSNWHLLVERESSLVFGTRYLCASWFEPQVETFFPCRRFQIGCTCGQVVASYRSSDPCKWPTHIDRKTVNKEARTVPKHQECWRSMANVSGRSTKSHSAHNKIKKQNKQLTWSPNCSQIKTRGKDKHGKCKLPQ